MTPRVSVVIPTRNRLAKFRRALAGARDQSFGDFEIIVADDASTDETRSWLRASRPDARLVAMERPVGAAAARNQALRHARGELVAFLDDDDAWAPAYLDAQVAHLDAHPAASMSYADHVERDALGRVSSPDTRPLLAYPSPLVRLLAEAFVHTLSVVVCHRSAFERFGAFDERLTIVHDLDWYGRVVAGGGSIVRLPRTLVEREVPGGLVTSHRTWCREERAVIARLLAGTPEADHHRMVRAYRALFFARLALAKGDLSFGSARLVEAFTASPTWAGRIALLRLDRRMRPGRAAGAGAWDRSAVGAP